VLLWAVLPEADVVRRVRVRRVRGSGTTSTWRADSARVARGADVVRNNPVPGAPSAVSHRLHDARDLRRCAGGAPRAQRRKSGAARGAGPLARPQHPRTGATPAPSAPPASAPCLNSRALAQVPRDVLQPHGCPLAQLPLTGAGPAYWRNPSAKRSVRIGSVPELPRAGAGSARRAPAPRMPAGAAPAYWRRSRVDDG